MWFLFSLCHCSYLSLSPSRALSLSLTQSIMSSSLSSSSVLSGKTIIYIRMRRAQDMHIHPKHTVNMWINNFASSHYTAHSQLSLHAFPSIAFRAFHSISFSSISFHHLFLYFFLCSLYRSTTVFFLYSTSNRNLINPKMGCSYSKMNFIKLATDY